MRHEFVLQPAFLNGGFDLYIVQRGMGGVAAVAEPVTMRAVKEGECVSHAPAAFLPMAAAQSLMDSLYAAGIRPAEARKNDDALAAAGRHIDDLRRVAFTLLDRTTKAEPKP